MKTRFFLFTLVAASIFIGCKDEGVELATSNEVDLQLLGVWYRFDTLGVQGTPNIFFRAMQILPAKKILPLGIEIATGKVALLENSYSFTILSASEGTLIVEYFASPGMLTDTTRYVRDSDTLKVAQGSLSGTYRRSQLGTMLAQPINATMAVTIDSTMVRSPSIVNRLSTFVVKTTPSLEFHSGIPNGSLTVTIDRFVGVGTYPIPANKGVLTLFSGDVIFSLMTDSLSTGTISIDEFNETTSRCAGRFAFTARLRSPAPQIQRQLRNGVFSVPIYWVNR